MAADIQEFQQALDKTWKTFSTQEVIDENAPQAQGEANREHMRYVETAFQQALARARTAFLQQFRNHSVVVESEVKKIRAELSEQLAQQYGEKIHTLQTHTAQMAATMKKHREEMDQLKQLTVTQEAFIIAIRHRWNQEHVEDLHENIRHLQDKVRDMEDDRERLRQELFTRDSLVAELRAELQKVETKFERQVSMQTGEKKGLEERCRVLRTEQRASEEVASKRKNEYEELFTEYQESTAKELKVTNIISSRRAEALQLMEAERERHLKARTKPTPRIGVAFSDYELEPAEYEKDAMGMDTSWRRARAPYTLTTPRRPTYTVDRVRRGAALAPRVADELTVEGVVSKPVARTGWGTPRTIGG